jgi:hypothetical protein
MQAAKGEVNLVAIAWNWKQGGSLGRMKTGWNSALAETQERGALLLLCAVEDIRVRPYYHAYVDSQNNGVLINQLVMKRMCASLFSKYGLMGPYFNYWAL